MVDFSACVDDQFLQQLDVEKGSRRIVTVEERAEVLQQLDGSSYQVSAGGSLSNTLLALARLGRAEDALCSRGPLRVAFDGIVGGDALSAFYSAQMREAGVSVLAEPGPNSSTGTVMVLTTPDANRTMLSYLGTPAPVVLDARLEAAIAHSRLLVIEGYVWEMPDAVASISAALEVARAHGTLVALTAGDAGLAVRKREELWGALHTGVDLLFTNRSEASALVGSECSAQQAALALGPHADMVVVTDGADGSCISALGSLQVVPPYWATDAPVDTCGAGDAYAAGVLWAYLRGMGVSAMGRAGARVASQVISRQGATLSMQDAAKLVQELPAAEASPALSSLSSADMW
jgi:sugar/nucleoside kinase (ribokinase family)